jgi:nucleotide-binding universal stress UspA family protein
MEEIRKSVACDLRQSFIDDFAGLTVERSVEVGDPAEIITRFADTHAVDLVMMPTHGCGPFREFLLGSVTSKVLHDCRRPVWTTAHVQEPPPLIHVDVRTILCAVDIASKSVDLLRSAAQFAENIGAKLRLVHVVPGPSVWINPEVATMFHDTVLDEERHSIEELQKSFGLAAPLCVATGDVAPAVREAAERHRADLVIIGRGAMRERMGRLRTNAYAIIRQSPCPVLSL